MVTNQRRGKRREDITRAVIVKGMATVVMTAVVAMRAVMAEATRPLSSNPMDNNADTELQLLGLQDTKRPLAIGLSHMVVSHMVVAATVVAAIGLSHMVVNLVAVPTKVDTDPKDTDLSVVLPTKSTIMSDHAAYAAGYYR